MEKKKYNLYDSFNVFLLCLIIPQVVALFVVLIGVLTMGKDAFSTSFLYVFASLTLSQLVFLAIYFIHKAKTKTSFKALNVNKISRKQVLIVVLIGLICVVMLTPLANVFEGLLTKWGYGSASIPLSLDNFWNFIFLFVTLGILAPASEEIIFRGVIFNGLKDKGAKFSVLISALLFMVMHLSINQCFYQFVMGVVLALLVLYTNSIVSSFVVHFINNAGVLLINYIIPSLNEVNYLSTVYIIAAIILFALAIVALYFCFKWLKKAGNKEVDIRQEGNTNTEIDNSENVVESEENANNLSNKTWKKPEKVYLTFTLILAVAIWIGSVLLTFLN